MLCFVILKKEPLQTNNPKYIVCCDVNQNTRAGNL